MTTRREPYDSDLGGIDWDLAGPCPILMIEEAGQRRRGLSDGPDALRWLVQTGSPWSAVYDQARRSMAVGCFEAMTAHDPRVFLRLADGRDADLSAVVLEAQTL